MASPLLKAPATTSGRTRSLLTAGIGIAGLVAVFHLVSRIGGGAVNDLELYLPGVDKFAHFVAFVALAIVSARLVRRFAPGTSGLLLLAFLLLLAAGEELAQGWTLDRHRDIGDFVAGACGAFAGMAWSSRSYRPRLAAMTSFAAVLIALLITTDSSYRQWHLNTAIRYARAGNLGDALRELRTAVARGNRSPVVLNELAWMEVESGQGDTRAAVAYAREALTLDPDNPDIEDTYGWALHNAGRSGEALPYLKRAYAKKPRMRAIHYHLGAAYLAVGEPDRAREHLIQQMQLPGAGEQARAGRELERIQAGEGQRR